MIKMQIIMDDQKIRRDKKYDVAKIHQALDSYMTVDLGLRKAQDGFYLGSNARSDWSHFGLAFNMLRKKDWFLGNVKTWLYFNSDASDDPEDFAVEDFKEFCLKNAEARV
jgi:hypothetical protein